jgi:hypothetical protein
MLLATVILPALFVMNNVQIVAMILAIVVVVIIIARRRSKQPARS